MSKQTALEYAEARLAKASAQYKEFEDDYLRCVEHGYAAVFDYGDHTDAYEKGGEHRSVAIIIDLTRDIIALLKMESE